MNAMNFEIIDFLHHISNNHVLSGLLLSDWIRVDQKLLSKLFESLPEEVTELFIGNLKFYRTSEGIEFEAITPEAYLVSYDTRLDV